MFNLHQVGAYELAWQFWRCCLIGAKQYLDLAMPAPLVPPSLVEAANIGPIFVVEQSDDRVRDTASHAHDAGQLIGSLAGLLSVATASGSWVVPATHAIWIPCRALHSMRSHGPFSGWSVYVAADACAELPTECRTIRVSGLLREAVHRAAIWSRPPETGQERRLAGVVLDEIATLPAEPLGLPHPSDPRVRRVTNGILADLADDRPLDAWAAWAAIAPRTLARRFSSETGFSFTEWRQRARALRSIELLAEGLAVTTIAIDLGYKNVSAFIAMFRRTMGVTPGRYVRSKLRAL
jgi:AraC-like DNA-binding protein